MNSTSIIAFVEKYFKPSPEQTINDMNSTKNRTDPLVDLYKRSPMQFPFPDGCGEDFRLLSNLYTATTLTESEQKNLVKSMLQLHAMHIEFTKEFKGTSKVLDTLTKQEIPCQYTELRGFFTNTKFSREYSRKLGPKLDADLKRKQQEFQQQKKQKEQEKIEKERRKKEQEKRAMEDDESSESESESDDGSDSELEDKKNTKKQKTTPSRGGDDDKLVQLGKGSSSDSSGSDSDDDDDDIANIKTKQTKTKTAQSRVSFDSTSSDDDSDSDDDAPKAPKTFNKTLKKQQQEEAKKKQNSSSSSSDSDSNSDSDSDSSSDDDSDDENNKDTKTEQDKPKKKARRSKKPKGPAKKYIIYIGNLPHSATKQDILEHFHMYSPTACRLLTTRGSNESRGICFMEFGNANDMQAVLSLDNETMNDKKLNISFAVGGKSDSRRDLLVQKRQSLAKEREQRRVKNEKQQRDADREQNGGDDRHYERKERREDDYWGEPEKPQRGNRNQHNKRPRY